MIIRNIKILSFVIFSLLLSCNGEIEDPINDSILEEEPEVLNEVSDEMQLVILGTVQDAGSPQIACQKECCINLFENPDSSRKVVSFGIIDKKHGTTYLFEASPDLPTQMEMMNRLGGFDLSKTPDAVFLTHAHIGHYTGLMYFGKEAMNANAVPVYAMPKMTTFLQENGPWSQLVANENIELKELRAKDSFGIGRYISVTPHTVPHRDEFSETVGFVINGPNKTVLFIPDIDKWEKWDHDINAWIKKVDYAFLDATFYDSEEINNRDISEIPHPFVIESMDRFKDLSAEDKAKIHFIHFNHTNPLLNSESSQAQVVEDAGFNIAKFGDRITL